jgi:hypothetical protein
MKYMIKWDIDTDGDFGFADYYTRDREKYGHDGDENYSGVVCFNDVCKAREFLRTMLSDLHVTSSHYWLLQDIYEKFEALISFCNEGERGYCDETFDGNAEGYISVAILKDEEVNKEDTPEEYKYYYVSYSGSTIVSARNEDEACELAADQINLEDINAYETDENGFLIDLP